MNDFVFRKALVLAIILSLIGMSIIPSTANTVEKTIMPSGKGKTLYVGGDGPGNYSTINGAYNDANPGDTIFVYSGTYNEYLHLEKTINLIGENEDTTSIIYNHKSIPPIRIDAPDIVISGFTLYNPNPNHVRYIDIYGGYNHTSISNCIFYNSPQHFDDDTVGIGIGYSSHHRISNCTFLYNDDEGICLNIASYYNIVENCVFISCCDGIELRNSSFNFIDNCTFIDGTHDGISFILPNGLSSNNNVISNCKFYNNYNAGIYMTKSCNNTIYNCTIKNNINHGISIMGEVSNSIIANCEIHSTIVGDGINIYGPAHDNIIKNNDIRFNDERGFRLEHTGYNNLIYHNNIIDNGQNAYDECDNIWDKGYPTGGNYWSDYTGIDNDGDGIGDTPYPIPGGINEDRYPLMDPLNGENQPPDAPIITGPTSGKVGKEIEFTFNAVDPDGDNVMYYINWGDGDSDETGLNPSGEDVKVKHTWQSEGTYTIRAYAEDEFGLASPEGTPLAVTITKGKNRAITSPFQWFLQQYQNLFPILKLLLLQR